MAGRTYFVNTPETILRAKTQNIVNSESDIHWTNSPFPWQCSATVLHLHAAHFWHFLLLVSLVPLRLHCLCFLVFELCYTTHSSYTSVQSRLFEIARHWQQLVCAGRQYFCFTTIFNSCQVLKKDLWGGG